MDQSLVHSFSWGNLYGPNVLKALLLKFPLSQALIQTIGGRARTWTLTSFCRNAQGPWLTLFLKCLGEGRWAHSSQNNLRPSAMNACIWASHLFEINICEASFLCKPSGLLRHSKLPRTPSLSNICPVGCFWGFQSGGPKFVKKNCRRIENLSGNCRFSDVRQIFHKFGSP